MWGTRVLSFCNFPMECCRRLYVHSPSVWPIPVSFGVDPHELTNSNGPFTMCGVLLCLSNCLVLKRAYHLWTLLSLMVLSSYTAMFVLLHMTPHVQSPKKTDYCRWFNLAWISKGPYYTSFLIRQSLCTKPILVYNISDALIMRTSS